MPHCTQNSGAIKDAPYPPLFPSQAGGRDEAASTSRIKAASVALITPSKTSTSSNTEEDAGSENGSSLVATGVVVVDPMDEIVPDPDLEFDTSATGTRKGADDVISLDSDDEDGGDAGTGARKDVVEAGAGVMDTTGSLIAASRSTLTNNNDKDAMSVNAADTEAAKNTKANTTGIKFIAMLNAKGVASIWSLSNRISWTVVSSSVVAILWRKTKTYKSSADIEKAISELLPEV